jgi:glycosyltransferase involved in cell wall biosynthesis
MRLFEYVLGKRLATDTRDPDAENRSSADAESGTAGVAEPPTTEIEVCYLINHLAPDGAPTVIESLVEEISAEDISFTVCFFGGDDTLQRSLEAKGARVVNFGATTDYPQFDPRALPTMVAFFAKESFDILHCHLPFAQSLGRLAGSLGDIDHVVSTQHNVPSASHPVERAAERVTRRLDTATVACSGGVESAYTGSEPSEPTGQGKWGTIQNGIDVEVFAGAVAEADGEAVRERWGVKDAAPLFVNIGRYKPQKAQATLVAAMERVAAKLPDAHLLIIGWGPLESELRADVRERGLSDAVTVTGRVPEIHPYYAAADTFVLPSRNEGLPVTILEAMAASCPIVATDIPGVSEVVEDSETGLLVDPGSPAALADALVKVGEIPDRNALGTAGYRRVTEQFSVRQMAADHVELYRALVAC